MNTPAAAVRCRDARAGLARREVRRVPGTTHVPGRSERLRQDNAHFRHRLLSLNSLDMALAGDVSRRHLFHPDCLLHESAHVSANIPGPIADQVFKLVESILFPGEKYARRLFKARQVSGHHHKLGNRRHVDVVGYGVVWIHALHQSAIGRSVSAAGVNVLVLRHSRKRIDLPAEQFSVKLLGAFWFVRWNFKPNDPRCCFFLRCAHISFSKETEADADQTA